MRTKSQIGKANRASGARFELKVRKDLEKKSWIVARWTNNVKLEECKVLNGSKIINLLPDACHELVAAKSTRFRSNTHGFPDFIIYAILPVKTNVYWENTKEISGFNKREKLKFVHYVFGVEVKSNGYLNPEEKTKCKWLLSNNVFSKILIAKKGKKRGEIIYGEFK